MSTSEIEPDATDREALRAEVRSFLRAVSPPTAVRGLMGTEPGYDPAVRDRMAGELGLVGLLVPEAYGGAGAGPGEAAVVMEEMGQVLLCAPFLSSAVMATAVLRASGSDTGGAGLLRVLATGRRRAAGPTARLSRSTWCTTGGSSRASSRSSSTGPGPMCSSSAETPARQGVFAVAGSGAGVRRILRTTLDLTGPQATIILDGAAGRPIGPPGEGAGRLRGARDLTLVLLAAEQVGGAAACLQASTGYARDREQFRPADRQLPGRPAPLRGHVRRGAGRAGRGRAGPRGLAAGPDGRGAGVGAYLQAPWDTVHIHGGLGFTWEHDAYLHVRRAQSSAVLLGQPDEHREALLQQIEQAGQEAVR